MRENIGIFSSCFLLKADLFCAILSIGGYPAGLCIYCADRAGTVNSVMQRAYWNVETRLQRNRTAIGGLFRDFGIKPRGQDNRDSNRDMSGG